jgi:hypothetical protein
MVAHTCDPSTWEAEVGGSGVLDHPGLHEKTLSQKSKQTKAKTVTTKTQSHKKSNSFKDCLFFFPLSFIQGSLYLVETRALNSLLVSSNPGFSFMSAAIISTYSFYILDKALLG